MTQNKIIGIDLAKSIFFLFEINHKGKNISHRKLTLSEHRDCITKQGNTYIRTADALANKLMRFAWAVISKNEEYNPA